MSDGPLGRYPYQVMGVALLGTYLTAINTTVLGVALPSISHGLGATGDGADWIINSYLLALAVSMPLTGWLAERLGRRGAFTGAVATFAIGAVVSAAAPDLSTLLVGRALQGLGGGPLVPLAVSMIYELFPVEKRGTVLGIWGIAVAAAPAVGPPLGGWLVTYASWRWIFAGLGVAGTVGFLVGRALLRNLVAPKRVPLDVRGWLAISTATVTLVILARQARTWGLTATPTLILAALLGVSTVVFVRGALRHPSPVLDVRVFRERTFTVTMAIMAIFSIGQYARLNFLPVELQVVRGMSALDVGLLMAPAALAVALAMPLGGRLSDRFGPRIPVTAGLTILATSMAGISLLQTDTPPVFVMLLLVAQGFGSGLCFSPVQVTAMAAVHSRLSDHAAAMTQLNRQAAAAVGTAVMAALLIGQVGAVAPVVETPADALAAQAGFNLVFQVAAAILGVAALSALLLPGRTGQRALQALRSAEHEDFLASLPDPAE